MTQPTLESFFSGGGGKTLSWKDMPIGTTYSGTILSIGAPEQATDPATKLPATTRQGKPRVQVRIDLQTTYRDATDQDDDGRRSLYVGGWMTGAVGDAIRKAGADGPPQVGATLTVRLTERESNGAGVNPTNKFDAHYVPPNPAADFFGGAPAAPAAQAPLTAPPVQQTPLQPGAVPAAQPPTMTPEQIAAFMAQQQAPVQQPVPQPNIAGTGYVQPPAPVAQPPAAALPPKPDALSQAAWDAMDDGTKRSVAATLGNVPPF